MNYIILSILFLISLAGCIGSKDKIEVNYRSSQASNLKSSNTLPVTVSDIQVTNNQFVVTGNNLTAVNTLQVKDGSTTTTLQIESKNATTLVANTLSSVAFSADNVLDFIFTSANAAATFQLNFSLCNSTLGGKSFKCTAIPNDKEVLTYDDSVGKWVPKNINALVTLNGLLYKGTWDALNDYPEPAGSYRDYYIVSVGGNGYSVGDYIVHDGSGWEKIGSAIQTLFLEELVP
ncbi:MAG: hypothetical protein U0T83_06485 [Bacteriovoracaceae bacterium]